MTPYFDDAGCTLYVGDALTVLRELPDESVQCCVTSPPFFGLRDYGTATWDGGDEGCDHTNGPLASPKSTLAGYTGDHVKLAIGAMPYRAICGKCGAKRIDQQIGLESSPAEYVAALVAVFREVRRVLRKDATLFLELGDSYAGAGYSNHANTGGAQREDGGKQRHTTGTGFKPKDLMMMPATVVIALRDDGWYLRAENVWHRPNPMPESVTDRTTRAHSMVYMLARSERYFYDAEAVREPFVQEHGGRVVADPQDWIAARISKGGPDRPCSCGYPQTQTGRNRRSVWTIPTEPTPFAHFATMATAVVRPCILAGTSPGDTVIDPFSGAGTTAMVAQQLGRRAIGIELNPTYADLSIERLRQPGMELAICPTS